MSLPLTPLWIAVGAESGAATAAALDRLLADLPPLPPPVRILSGDREQVPAAVVAAVRARIPGVDGVAAPPSLAGQALALGRSADFWRTIPVDLPGTMLASVALPAALMDARSFVYLVRSRRNRRDDPLALDLLARHVHPRLALLLRGDADRAGLAAEINLAAQPRAILVRASLPPWSLVVATADLIAADLFGLAFREHFLPPGTEVAGPWEDRLVQRATELGLGVTVPAQLELRIVPCSPRFDPARPPAEVMQVLIGVNQRLGIGRPPAMLGSHGE